MRIAQTIMPDQKAFRHAMGAFVTGVTVVTATAEDGTLLGVTANSFNSVSLDPPLVLVSLARTLQSFEAFAGAHNFAINLLSRDQHEVCMRFAGKSGAKWDRLTPEYGELNVPLVPGRLAHFECRNWARYDGGDHLILVGEVEDFWSCPVSEPLVYFRGQFPDLHAPAKKESNA